MHGRRLEPVSEIPALEIQSRAEGVIDLGRGILGRLWIAMVLAPVLAAHVEQPLNARRAVGIDEVRILPLDPPIQNGNAFAAGSVLGHSAVDTALLPE